MSNYDLLKSRVLNQEEITSNYWSAIQSRLDSLVPEFEKFIGIDEGQKNESGIRIIELRSLGRFENQEKLQLSVRLGTQEQPEYALSHYFWFHAEAAGFKIQDLDNRYNLLLYKKYFGNAFWGEAFERIFKTMISDIGRDSPPRI